MLKINYQQIVHKRESETYIIRYSPGKEEDIIKSLMNWAVNPELEFDCFDTVEISLEIERRMFGDISNRL